MAEQQAQKPKKPKLLQFSGDNKDFHMVISEELETKIRIFCALSPSREWSGVLFYKFSGNFESGVTILAEDMLLMDQGNGVHTEFDLDNPEITRHMYMEGLIGHCMGLIHSHNKMQAFFSGEDAGTLTQHGEHMNNFVSLVVNNEGQYVARLTRQVHFEGSQDVIITGKSSSPLFNTDEVEEEEYEHKSSTPLTSMFIEYVDLNITKPTVDTLSASLERFGEVSAKCSVQKAAPVVITGGTKASEAQWPYAKQGTLFKEDDDEAKQTEVTALNISEQANKELNSIPWKKLGFENWFAQLVYGSPFSKTTVVDYNAVAYLNRVYKERFPSEPDFSNWFDYWLDFMISEFKVFTLGDDSEFTDAEEALIYKTYTVLMNKSFVYKDAMLESLLNRLL